MQDLNHHVRSWAEILHHNPEIIMNLEPSMQSVVLEQVAAYNQARRKAAHLQGKHAWATQRHKALASGKAPFLAETFVQTLVIISSAIIFGTAGMTFAKNTIDDERLAIVGGILIGMVAGCLVDVHGKRVFTGLSMHKDYQAARKLLDQTDS